MARHVPASGHKPVEHRLFVHVDMGDSQALRCVGQLLLDDTAPGGFAASFTYMPEWSSAPDSFALDPLNMPLQAEPIETTSKYIRLGVLFDAAPDLWGRRVLQAETGQAFTPEHEVLLKGRGNGVGALLFSASDSLERADLPRFETLPTVEDDLERVHEAVQRVESNTPLPERLQGLLGGSWSMGGAQPKAVMRDRTTGDIWLAKFSVPGAPFDRPRVEWANLKMAEAIGLPISPSHIVETSRGSVLLTRRFDRDTELHRRHYLSAISLISAEPEDKRLTSPRDQAIFSYARIAEIISRVSDHPERERKELFARMVLNICVHNTDDHLKNIGFLLALGTKAPRLELAPVFDVVTQTSLQHYLTIGLQGRVGSLENALSVPRRYGLTERGAKSIAQAVVDVVADRARFYEQAGLSEQDQATLNGLIESRCPAAAAPPAARPQFW